MEEFKSTLNQEINKLQDQKSSLEEESFRLRGQIKASKGSITIFDKEINDLKIQVRQLTTERNGLQEEVEGIKAEGKKLASKFTE
jgi:predicted  nucleic acid-binding Zn-ribbon protein